MGVFNYIDPGDKELLEHSDYCQVKIWNFDRSSAMKTYVQGSQVPKLGPAYYSVRLRERPIWMNVQFDVIVSFTPLPQFELRYDKFGNILEEEEIDKS